MRLHLKLNMTIDVPLHKTASDTVKYIENLLMMKISKAKISCENVEVEEFRIVGEDNG